MPKTRESNGSGALYLGTLIVIVSVVIWSEYKTYYLGTWIALCAGGFVLWFIGFASTRHLTSAGSQVKSELAGSSRESCLQNILSQWVLFPAYRAGNIQWSETISVIVNTPIEP